MLDSGYLVMSWVRLGDVDGLWNVKMIVALKELRNGG